MASLTDQLPIYGGADDDALVGDTRANVIHGDAGDDTLSGEGGADTLIGGLGDDLLFGGSGANVLYGGAGADILTYDSADANGQLQRLFGGDGTNTLVLEFAQDDYLEPGVIDEVEAYANALAAGENPGGGGEFVFSTFALRASNFSNILIFVDGAPLAPGEVPGIDAVDDAFGTTESGSISDSVVLNDNFPAGALVSLLAPPASGDLTLQNDGTFTFDTDGAFEAASAGETTTVTFTYRLTEDGDTSDATVEITVSGENDAPTAGAATASTDENQDVSGDLIADSNAADVDASDVLTILSVNGQALGGAAAAITLPSGAVITVAPSGGYTYAPGAAFDGLASGDTDTDVVTFVISDGQGGQVASSLTLTINGENDAPVANPDAAMTTEGAAVTFDVLGNDTDIDQGDVLTLVSVDGVTGGGSAVMTPAGQIQFQPGADFQALSVGASAFVEIAYTMQDASGARSSSVATVTVTGANDAPTADAIADSTTEDANLTGNLLADANADDIDSADVLTISAIDGAAFAGGFSAPTAGGALLTVLANGDYTYAPTAGFTGLGVGETASDSFTFTVDDGRGGAVTRTFSIDITGENDGPVVQDIAITVAENDGANVDLLADSNAFDPDDNGVLSLTLVNGAAPDPQSPFFDGSDGGQLTSTRGGEFTFDTQSDFEELSVGDTATTTFTFTIEDDQGAAVTRTLSFTVEGTNDDPTADTVDLITDEDTAATGNFLDDSNAFDIDQNDTLTITEIDADGLTDGALNGAQRTIVLPNGATLTVAPNGDYSYLPGPLFQQLAEGQTGSTDFSFRVSDGQGGEIDVTVDVSIDGVNDDPTADAITRGALEDDTVSGDLLADSNAADVDDGDILNLVAINGQLVDTGGTTIAGADGGTLFASTNGGYTFNPNGDFEQLSVGDTATSAFSFRIADSFGGSTEQTITFEIAGANDAPEVDDIAITTDEDTAFSGNLLIDGAASDIDQNDDLVISQIFDDSLGGSTLNGATQVLTLSSGAQLTVSPDGSYTYDPLQLFQSLPEGGSASDALSFQVADGNGGFAQGRLDISITGVNDAPTLDAITAATTENAFFFGDLLTESNADDVDFGDSVSVLTVEGQNASNNTATIERPGEGRFIAFNSDYNFNPLTDFDRLSVGETEDVSFEFTVTDTFGGLATSTITITVTGENDGPTAEDFDDATTEDDDLSGNLLADGNAQDVDQSDVLTITAFNATGVGDVALNGAAAAVTLASGARLTVNPDGDYTLDPNGAFEALSPGETAIEAFSFTVSDGNGGETTQTATITINGVNDAPVAVDDTATTDQDTGTLVDILGNDSDVDSNFTLTSVTTPDNGGRVDAANGVFFDPNGQFDFLGQGQQTTTTFTYTITDDEGATDTADVVVTVTGLNDGPITSPLSATTDEDRAAFMFDLLTNQIDVDDGDVLSVENFVEIVTTFGAFSVANNIFTFDARQFDNLNAGDSQTITYGYDVVDSFGARATNQLTLTVEGRDEGLVATDDNFSITEDDILTDDVSLNDTVGTGVISLDQDVAAGLLTLNTDGTFTFDTNGEFDSLADGDLDSVMFTYVIDDGVSTAMATATIDIIGVNDGLIADGGLLFTDEDNAIFVNLIDESNAFDPDGQDPIELDELDGVFMPLNGDDVFFTLSSGASIQANRAGEIVYDPIGAFDDLSDGELAFETFSYILVDDFGDGLSISAEVEITGVNDPLQADNASFFADEDLGASDDLIDLSNVFDLDVNDEFFITDVDGIDVTGGATITLGSGALLTIDEFGAFTYDTNGQFETLAEGETDLDTFDYGITDGFETVNLTADITIDGVNDDVIIDDANSDLAASFTSTGGGPVGAPVISATALDGTNGFALFNAGVNERGGAAVAGGGDFNGDGIDDVVVGIPVYSGFYVSASGSAFVLFGDGAGTPPASRSIPVITPDDDGISLLGAENERLGEDASFVGDVNGDGFDDFLIGNGRSPANGANEGVARLVFGRDFTGVTGYDSLGPANSTEFIDSSTGSDDTRSIGASVSSAGDINADGINDFIIGAPARTSALDDLGKAFVIFGRSAADAPFGATFDLATLDGTNGFRIDTGAGAPSTYLGQSVGAAGDLNGDGIDDVIIGSPGSTEFVPPDGTAETGASYVIFGSDSGFAPSVDVTTLSGIAGFAITDSYSSSAIGQQVTGIGDFNGDGLDDFIIGANYDPNFINDAGAAYIVYGTGAAPTGVLDLDRLTPTQGFKIVGGSSYDYVGQALAAAGDFNGDGLDDVIIGAPSNFEGALIGKAYVLFGTDQTFAAPLDLADFDADDGVLLTGFDTGDNFGAEVSGAGDLNQDGFDDVIVGAPLADNGQTGAAFVFFGAASASTAGPVGGVGSVFFEDVDLSDTHTVSDDAVIDDIDFTFDLLTDSTGGLTGEAQWTSEIDQGAFDALAEGDIASLSVNVTIEDAFGGQDTVTIDIEYVGINDAPTAEAAARTTDEDTVITDGDLIVEGNVMDVDTGDDLRIASISFNTDSGLQVFDLTASPTVVAIQGAILTIDETGAYSLDPTGEFEFLDDGDTSNVGFNFVVEDLAGATAEAFASISITGVNDAPTAVDDAVTTDQDTVAPLNLFDNDTDPEGGLSIRSLNTTGLSGTVVIENVNTGQVVYNPNGAFDFLGDGEQATDTFSYVLQDSGGLTSTADVTVTVTGLNDAPVASDVNVSTSEDDTVAGNFLLDGGGLDVDQSDVLVVQSIDGVAVTGANQTINLASGSRLLISPDGEFTYNPFFGSLQTLAEGDMADDVISVVISDGVLTATSDLVVSVTGVNDAPTTTPLSRATNEDEVNFQIDLLANAVDIDNGDVLSVENFVEDPTDFRSFSLNGADLTYNATIFDDLDAGETQVIDFTYDIVDSEGARVATTLQLTIEGRDEALLAVDDGFSTDEDTPISGDVSTNDVDQGAVFSLVSTPNGDIIFNTDGTFDYDPTAFFNTLAEGERSSDTFTYQIDNGTDTVTANVTITVDGINDAPAIFLPGVTNVRLVTEDVTDTAGGDQQSVEPALSGDGDTVTFDSNAANLIDSDTNARGDVYFEDPAENVDRANLQNGTNNQSITSGSATSEVNKDGSVIVFQSRDEELVPTTPDGTPIPNNNNIDIFVRDLNTGETQLLIPFGTDGARLNGNSLNASVSANGRFVTFESTATNLVTTGDINNGNVDIFWHDRDTGETILVSQLPATVETNSSFRPSISADGNTIAFLTANSHDAADDNGLVDVYAYNVADETLTLVSQSSGGVVADRSAVSAITGGAAVSAPSVSANGRYIAWVSNATNLVDDDTNNVDDIFVHDLFFGTTERASVTFGGIEGDGASFDTKISDNGRYVTFQSQANTLDDLFTDTNGDSDVYVKDRLTDDLIRVSITPDFSSEPGGRQPDISADGTKIAFASGTVTGNFDARVVTGGVNDIYIATIETTGYTFSQNTPFIAAVVDLEVEWFDPDGDLLEFSNIDVTSDDTDRFFTFQDVFDDNGRVIGFGLDPSEFADLGVNDYELLTATYDVTDGFVSTSGVTGVVIVGENDAPTADAQAFDVNQGGSVAGSFFALDIDDDSLTFDFLASALQGDLQLDASGEFLYTAAANQTSDETITIDVSDGNGGFTTFDATFNVNLAPIFTPTNEIEVALTDDLNPAPNNSIDASAFFGDPEGTDLTFSAVTRGFTTLRNGLSIDAVSGVITGTPSASDLVRIEVTATDGAGLSTTGDFWLATVAEVVVGDANDNNIVDDRDSSFIDGLAGNDSITGDSNFDVYQYRRGEGFDIIDDNGGGGNNRLVLTGYDSDEVQFNRFAANPFDLNGTDLLITPVGQPIDFTEGVLVRGALVPLAGPGEVAFYHFDDGVILDEVFAMQQILDRDSTEGDDDIRGFAADNTLAGGLGDDVLSGGDGSDLYIYNAGDGDDTIRDNGNRDNDIIEIGYNFADAAYSRIPGTNDIVLDFGGGDRLTVVDTLHLQASGGIEVFRFLDGDFTIADIRADLISQQVTAGDDLVRGYGLGIADTLEGGAGDDTLLGFDGGDTYVYRAGDGDDVFIENGFQDNDVIQVFDFTIDYDLANGVVNPGSQVTFERVGQQADTLFQGDDLIINFDDGAGTTGSILSIGGIDTGNTTPLSSFVFDASGVTLTGAQIRSDILRQSETSGDDIVRGFNSADTLNGGAGDDLLLGRDSADIYVFAAGDGDDTVFEGGFQDNDRVQFTDRNLADFEITYGPQDDDTVIFTAGTDRIEVVQGLESGFNQTISFFDFADQTLTTNELRQVIVDQALTVGGDLIGGPDAQAMPSSPGSDRFVQGRDGSDTYVYAAGDGNDTVHEGNTADNDVLDLRAFSSQDFKLAGPNSIRFDPAFTDRVQLFINDSNTLDIIGVSQFEQVQFLDQTFDNDANDADGATNFSAFITSLVDEALLADPNEDVITKVILQDPGGNNTLTSTVLNENIRLDNSGDDQVIFNVSEIGEDSIFKDTGTTAGYDITIDFSGIFADNVLQESVFLSVDRVDQHDLIIDIIYEDTALIDPVAGIGLVEERIVINNALETFGGVDTITIIDNQGRTVDLDGAVIDPLGLAPTFDNTNEIRQFFIDRAVTAGDDLIPNYFASGLTLRGGGGDDTLSGARGGQTFEFSPGDGRVTVAEFGQSGGGTDVVAVNGFSLADATISRAPFNSSELIFDFGGGDQLLIRNFYPGGFVIEQFVFQADTTPEIVTGDQIATAYINGLATSGDDILIGGDGRNETLDGGTGNDTLDGQDGSDTYIVRRGEGDKLIRETGAADTDVLQLDVASTSVTFEQNRIDPNNFIIVMDDGTRVEIVNFLEGNDGKIEQFVFTDTTLDTTQARLQAFDDLATNGDDTIIGGDAPDTLRGGPGDDVVRGDDDNDVFIYAIGDGDDTLTTEGADNEFELIQITGVDASDVIISRVPGTRDLRNSQSSDEDYLITFAGAAGSIRVENGLSETGLTDRIEIVDSGVRLTDQDIFNNVIANDIANGRKIIEGPTIGRAFFPSGAEFIFAQRQGDLFQFTAGQGTLTILDDDPANEIQRLEVLGYNSTEAAFSRLAAGSEDFIIRLPDGDQIIVIGEQSGGVPINGVNEIFFAGDNIVFNDADITTLIDGGFASGGSGGGGGGSGRVVSSVVPEAPAEPVGDAVMPVSDDDSMVLSGAADVMRLGAGDDHIRGRGGDDALWGQAGDDTLMGNGGADTLRGGAGEDDLRGGAGRDKLIGGGDDDMLRGNGGRDMLKGGRGEDDLMGGLGDDVLKGGGGDDRIEGGKGDDRLKGQGGEDMFVFAQGFGADVITDFRDGVDMLDFASHNAVSALGDLAITQVGANTLITDGVGGQITLLRVDANDLQEDDFLF